MKGTVKYVKREVWYTECQSYHWSSDVHPVRHTFTYAVLYNGNNVYLDEDDIRSYYDRSRITRDLIYDLSKELHNINIEYYEDDDNVYCLDGTLADYI